MVKLVWTQKLFQIGYERKLENIDIYDVLPEDSSIKLSSDLAREWEKELYKWRSGTGQPSLLRALVKCHGWSVFGLTGLLLLLEESLRVIQTVLLAYVLSYFEHTSAVSKLQAYIYATSFCLAYIFASLLDQPAFHNSYVRGLQMKVACSSLIYRKVLRLQNIHINRDTSGDIARLMSEEVHKFNLSVIAINYLWIGPLQALVIGWLLWQQVGLSCLPGLGLLLVLVPLQLSMNKVFHKLRGRISELTHQRLQIVNELLCNLKLVKLCNWEMPFLGLVSKIRKLEMSMISQTSYCRGLLTAFFFSTGKLVMFCTFATHIFSGNFLTAQNVFVSMAMFEMLRTSLSLLLPWGLQHGLEAFDAINRIQKFLLLEEKLMLTLTYRRKLVSAAAESNEIAIIAKDFSACWNLQKPTPSTLESISVVVKRGQLLVVAGASGSGKTSFLMAILGEIPEQRGQMGVSGKVSFCGQRPWMFSASIRENILFGSKWDKLRYTKAVEACGLTEELEGLPDGDLTIIGEESGQPLTVEQRAKLNLARAVYHQADIYLIDDPFEYLDVKTGRHIFNSCFCQLLQDKTVILVTNRIHYLRAAEQILVLTQGAIRLLGNPLDLINQGVDLEKVLGDCGLVDVEKSLTIEDSIVDSALPTVIQLRSEQVLESTDDMDVELEKMMKEEDEFASLQLETHSQVSSSQHDQPVGRAVYLRYFYLGGGVIGMAVFLLVWFVMQSTYVMCDWWLAYWSLDFTGEINGQKPLEDLNMYNSTTAISPMNPHNIMVKFYVFAGLTAGVLLLSVHGALTFFYMAIRSAKKIHQRVFHAMLYTTLDSFSEHNPIKLLTCFSQNMNIIDNVLPICFFDAVQCLGIMLSAVIVAAAVNFWVLLVSVPLLLIFLCARKYYIKTAKDIKAIEYESRAPLYNHLTSTLRGIWTVRAFGSEERFLRSFDRYQDRHTAACFMSLAINRWFAFRLEILCMVFVVAVCYGAMFVQEFRALDAGLVGLSLTYAMNMLGLFQWSVRQSADVETQMTSVEKTLAYTSLVTEDTEPATPSLMPSNWPQYGIITYEGVSVNHNNDNTKALRNAWCCIRAHEMVGIVGKAGAGKKTFLSALLGLVPSSGTIRIDGINIHEIPLPKLRESIAVIPENPVLFYGTVRDNIDPHGDVTDDHIWKMLDEVHLKEKVLMLPENLYTETCADNPCGFSTSQLQLVCVARAALKQKKILVLEEAVTNTDWRGSALIQQTIKTLFKHCTVVTLAHRLRTIIDYDRVMVLETGRINEFDTPYELLQNQNGAFYKMSLESGEDFKTLLQIAQHKFENKPYRSPSLETILSTEVNMNFSSAPVRSPNNFLPAFQTLRLTRTINHLSTGGNRFSMTDD